MGSSPSRTFHVLVIGLPGSGKSHFLDMFIYGNDSTKFPTQGFYESCTTFEGHLIYFYECAQLQCLPLKRHISYNLVLLLMRADETFEYYQRSKNLLLHALKGDEKVCLIFNHFRGSVPKVCKAFKVPAKHQVRLISIDISDLQKWSETVFRLLQWLTQPV